MLVRAEKREENRQRIASGDDCETSPVPYTPNVKRTIAGGTGRRREKQAVSVCLRRRSSVTVERTTNKPFGRVVPGTRRITIQLKVFHRFFAKCVRSRGQED